MWNKFIDDWKTPVEYIDREAAVLALAEQGFDYDKAKQALASTPSADVVPVVQCKDCKYFYNYNGEFCGCTSIYGMTDPDLDDFCSYGERKDGGADNE